MPPDSYIENYNGTVKEHYRSVNPDVAFYSIILISYTPKELDDLQPANELLATN